MSLKDSILEKGYWEPAKEEKQSSHSRARKWCVDIASSVFIKDKQIRRTAYLDGLRGFAAFLVYWHHHQLWARDSLEVGAIFENAFGYDKQYYFGSLPFVRTFFTGGHYAVTIFFVISGYVLSAKPMMLIQSGDLSKLSDNLASALFRRWPRLHIPVIVTTFCYLTFWHAFGVRAIPDPQGSYRDEVVNWFNEFKNFSFVFRSGGEPWFTYNFHSWSIPVEYRGSIVIYTALLAFSRLKRDMRLWCEVGLIWYFMYIADGWFCALFVSGMMLCDLDLLAAANQLPRFLARLEPYSQPIFYSMFVISVYLGGVPSHSFDIKNLRESPGWYFLSFLKPQAVFDYKWFYLFWAATFAVASIQRISWLKSFFETPFCQYLGRISFALYLVHGPVLWILGDRLYAAVGWARQSHGLGLPGWTNKFPLPKGGPLGLEFAFFAVNLVTLPVTLWLAEIVTRLVDEPSVTFSQWMYQKVLAPPPEKA